MTDTSSRSRVPTGVPTGGEFATEAKGENPDLDGAAAITGMSWAGFAEETAGSDAKAYRKALPVPGTKVFIHIEDGDEPNDTLATVVEVNHDYGSSSEFLVLFPDGTQQTVMDHEMFPPQSLLPEAERVAHRRAAMAIAVDRETIPAERVAKLMDLVGITGTSTEAEERIDPATGSRYRNQMMSLDNPRNGKKLIFPYANYSPEDVPDPKAAMFMLLYGGRERYTTQARTLSDWAQDHGYAMGDEFEAARAQNTWDALNRLGDFLGDDAYSFRTASVNR